MTMVFLRSLRLKIFLLGALVVFLAAFFFLFFFRYQVVRYSQARLLLGTFVQIHICATRAERQAVLRAFDKAWKRLGEINERMNGYNEKSDIAKINHAYPRAVQVHSDVYQILALSKNYSELTRGAFDVTVWPLAILWRDAQTKQRVPLSEDIRLAQAAVGSDKIKLLPDNYVQLMHPKTKIDLSAIGQGYAADEAAAILRNEGLKDFLVDAGGEIFAQGLNESGHFWCIGIKDPVCPENIINAVWLSNRGVSTSGDYEKYYEINHKRYSHILDPLTGNPADHVVSATVICQDATQADVFSTVLCILGKQGIGFVESLAPQTAISVIEQSPDGSLRFYKNDAYLNMCR